jgi:hypothetical protein
MPVNSATPPKVHLRPGPIMARNRRLSRSVTAAVVISRASSAPLIGFTKSPLAQPDELQFGEIAQQFNILFASLTTFCRKWPLNCTLLWDAMTSREWLNNGRREDARGATAERTRSRNGGRRRNTRSIAAA